ncbi:unnamed protein product [Urochloa decumbens]|uniref:F-box domain-containing protein n=1 Tax=Urochloa decumbens TaxID=240449 RepID=A0ABC9AMY0_9POAL
MDYVNNDILVLILERVNSYPGLIRGAATCKLWRHTVADAGFLRRYRSLHGPTIAGNYFDICLPSLRHALDVETGSGPGFPHIVRSPDLAVCEPLTRRHVRILAPGMKNDDGRFTWGLYLIDGVDDAGRCSIGMSNFRVMCVFHRDDAAHAGVFTAGGDSAETWIEMGAEHIPWNLDPWMTGTACLGRARGSWYFFVAGGTLIALDGSTGEFSSYAVPAAAANTGNWWDPYTWMDKFAVTDGWDGRPPCFVVVAANGVMKVHSMLDDEWVLEKEVVLSKVAHGLPGYKPSFFLGPVDIVARGIRLVILSVRVTEDADTAMDPFSHFFSSTKRWLFSIDLETMQVAPAAEGLGGNGVSMRAPVATSFASLHR